METHKLKVWVTKNNQIWASEMTGLSLEEIKRRYSNARKQKIICTIEVDVPLLNESQGEP